MKEKILPIMIITLCFLTVAASAATIGELNAVGTAKAYLSFSHFSYKGLIDQLKFEGYSDSECKYAADNCGADWFDQAVGSAKDYMSFTSFSKKGLIDQLIFEGFSKEESEYGAAVAYGEKTSKPSTVSSSDLLFNFSGAAATTIPEETPTLKELPKNGTRFDLSGLSYEELSSLQEQVQEALSNYGK